MYKIVCINGRHGICKFVERVSMGRLVDCINQALSKKKLLRYNFK